VSRVSIACSISPGYETHVCLASPLPAAFHPGTKPTCVYCGQTELKLTRDHVPPKCLFQRPRPKLITVPACHACNDAFKLDDEYFRAAVCIEAAYFNSSATELWQRTVAPGMGTGLRKSLLGAARRASVTRSSDTAIVEQSMMLIVQCGAFNFTSMHTFLC